MKKFMDESFLLSNEAAEKLYHEYSKQMPIIDYHCHINPKEILDNRKFENITQVWLYGDHYKWRAMRTYGIDEKYITGDGTDYEKFLAWAKTISAAIGNPLYHWTHLELKRFFEIDEVLNEKTASAIWDKVNAKLNSDEFTVRELIKKSNVKVICTTDDPVDSLEYHLALKEDKEFDVKVLPAFRPDKALGINKDTFKEWFRKLEQADNCKIKNFDDYLAALKNRVEFFHEVGCRVSDNALDFVPVGNASKEEVSKIFDKVLKGEQVSFEDENKFRAFVLKYFGKLYHDLGWVMQLHMNCVRDNNTKMFEKLGPDTGFDSLNDTEVAIPLSRLLDSLNCEDALPKTIIYSLNANDNATIGTLLGCFQGDGIKGKIQFGSAWWFNDHKLGMEAQIKSLANLGMLSTFVGMLTDSRSFLSYTRHEYFRRILCNVIGEWVENGELPNDIEGLGQIVSDISYNNAKNYFNM
ncbi:glucuronate isomerase [Clostridium saccharobutylicum]|uniref:Uronate isomerase n=1 Tax=Clostridium saccharobutylicum DSM 13864 TaxID=1345695 RepID=U5MQ86_CLOSA|nr:glucuronate isomerase [Clostridium saccharobutylicum]AGX42934.1 uronate isomerase UxaC [Clostridium saccharobutylicum DSM 13864]AQR90227.1 uronate isomerase [Clostridium saccharobutylicum]AQS00133.1 uronate isomerase [Clostridium saccharobutylicum]AQS09930.1 uronate isomerase [Clostridium saccharobutylicum]AQS14116.1 uronate isomerase [Clostridium saccharobutylicum]